MLFRSGLISTQSAGVIALSGHSGGYKVISSVISAGGMPREIQEVFLFDALYGQIPKFVNWLKAPGHRLAAITSPEGGTLDATRGAVAASKKERILVYSEIEDAVQAESLRTNQFSVVASALGHNEVMHARAHFKLFLETSRLTRIVRPPSP